MEPERDPRPDDRDETESDCRCPPPVLIENRPSVDDKEGRCKLELDLAELINVEEDSEVRASVAVATEGPSAVERRLKLASSELAPGVSGVGGTVGSGNGPDKEVAARIPPVMSEL